MNLLHKHLLTIALTGLLLPALVLSTEVLGAESKLISRHESVYLESIVINSPVLQNEINELSQKLLKRDVPISELMAFKNSINEMFAANGFINTGVRIPDQQIENGIIKFDVIEGKISAINIDSKLRDRYISKRLKLSRPFNLVSLQASLKLLEKDPFVHRIDANISPGTKSGSAEFFVKVETNPRFKIALDAANNRSPSVGSENTELSISTSNLTGWGDYLMIASSVTEGLDAQNLTFSIPFTRRDYALNIHYSKSNSSVIEEPFAAIDVESETESLNLGFDFPIFKTLEKTLALHILFEARKNQTTLLGQTFSFSEGAINGESRVSPVRMAVSYSSQQRRQSFATRISVSKGTHHFEATENLAQADGDFTTYLAQIQYSRQIGDRVVLSTRLLAQYASDPLLSIEKFSLGGMGSVRGYRQNQIVRDNAYLASIEGRYRLNTEYFLELVIFTDWGSGENHSDAISQGRDSIYSAGIGISYKGFKGLSADLYIAHGFKDFKVTERDLQDDGIHFQLRYEYVF